MGSLIHVTAWERVSLWRRVLCAFARVGILIAFVGVLIELLGPPISIFFTARWEARKLPGVKVAPRPLADYSVSDASGTALSYFGYEFDVPWNASFKEKAFSKNGIVQIEFESGQNVTFIVPKNQSGLLTEIVQDESMHMKNLQVVFGDLMNRSPYDQQAALLNTTPSSIRASASGLETGVFSFQLPDKRGFQIGDPQKSRRVDLEVFDIGGHHVEIICATAKEGIRLSQPELNRILKSFHLGLAGSSGAPPAHTAALRN